MSNVQTQRLNNITGTLLKGSGKIFKAVLCEELAVFFKRFNVVDTKKHVVSRDVGLSPYFFITASTISSRDAVLYIAIMS